MTSTTTPSPDARRNTGVSDRPWLQEARRHGQLASDKRKEIEMRIVVVGGTGLIGSKLVEKLREDGHDPLAASPDTGVNTLTGEGLAEALEGAEVVVDVANAPAWEDDAVMEFFQTSTSNVLAAETAAGVEPPRRVVGRGRRPARGQRVHAREGRPGGRDQGRGHSVHNPPRDAVLRVHRPHRRLGHERRDDSSRARPRSARGSRRRRRRTGGHRSQAHP